MRVQVRVNERGALRNGRFAFTNRLTLVSELLQNSRRAGATQVTINHDETARRVTVIDDGCGIPLRVDRVVEADGRRADSEAQHQQHWQQPRRGRASFHWLCVSRMRRCADPP